MTKCSNHPTAEAVYNGLCQPCLNAAKKNAVGVAPAAQQWTPAALKKTFGSVIVKLDKTSEGHYLVNGSKGMHLHCYGSDFGVHVKIGNDKYLFISKPGKFMDDAWNGAVAAITSRATGELRTQLLAAMALMLAERGGGLSEVEIGKYIAALPIPPA